MLANVSLKTILLNYLQIWSNMLPAAMQNEDLIIFFFTVSLASEVTSAHKIPSCGTSSFGATGILPAAW